MLGLNVEGPAVIYFGHLIHEVDEVMAAGEHERVDRDVLAGAADDLAERRLERAFRRRVVGFRERAPPLEGRRRLAGGGQDDLLVLSPRSRQERPGGLR